MANFIQEFSGDYHLFQKGQISGKLLVAFSAMGKHKGHFNYVKSLSNAPYDILFVSCRNSTWYQHGVSGMGREDSIKSSIEFIENLAKEIDASKIYTFGSSMGGYAALLFGALMGGLPTLAIDAETLLDTPDSRSIKHMPADEPRTYIDLRPILAKNPVTNRWLYSSEMGMTDIYAAKRCADLINVVTLSDVSHAAAPYIHSVCGIGNFITTFVEDKKLPKLPNEGNILKYPEAVDYLTYCWEHIKFQRYVNALETAKAAVDISDSPAAWYAMGVSYLYLNDYENAIKAQRKTILKIPRFPRAHLQLGLALVRNKNYQEAIDAMSRCIEMTSKIPAAFFQRGLAYYAVGNFTQAENDFYEAWKIDKKNPLYIEKLRSSLESRIEKCSTILNELSSFGKSDE